MEDRSRTADLNREARGQREGAGGKCDAGLYRIALRPFHFFLVLKPEPQTTDQPSCRIGGFNLRKKDFRLRWWRFTRWFLPAAASRSSACFAVQILFGFSPPSSI